MSLRAGSGGMKTRLPFPTLTGPNLKCFCEQHLSGASLAQPPRHVVGHKGAENKTRNTHTSMRTDG